MASWKGAALPAAAIGLRVPMKVLPSRLLAGLTVILALSASALASQKDYAIADFQTAKGAIRDAAAAKTLIERAGMRLSKYGVDGALLDFDKAISLDPDNADAYLGRSRAKTLKGDNAGAAADCRRAIALDPARAGSCGDR